MHGLYAGAVLSLAGFIFGKFWSLKWESGDIMAAEAGQEQIDLFEPRKEA